MNISNMTKYAVGLLVGLVMVAGLIIPIVDAAQQNAGPSIEFVNEDNTGSNLHYGAVQDINLVIDSNGATVNGKTIERAIHPIVLFVSDNIEVNLPASSSSATMECYALEEAFGQGIFGGTLTITVENNKLHVVAGSYSTDFDYTWMVSVSDNGQYINHYYDGSSLYCKDSKDIIVCGGYYSSGENDTYYSYYDGSAHCSNKYTASFSNNAQLLESTTDVYTTKNPQMHIDNESFTPHRFLITETVSGHETSGGSYALLGVIPLVAIICLVVFAAGAIRARRY